MAGFERAQLPHEGVVLGVRDLRGIQHMILIFVVSQFVAQLVDTLSGFNLACCAAGWAFGHSVHYRKVPETRATAVSQLVLTEAIAFFVVFCQGKPHLAIFIRPQYCETALLARIAVSYGTGHLFPYW